MAAPLRTFPAASERPGHLGPAGTRGRSLGSACPSKAVPVAAAWGLLTVLICIFLMTDDGQVSFHALLGHLRLSWRNVCAAPLPVHKSGCLLTTEL